MPSSSDRAAGERAGGDQAGGERAGGERAGGGRAGETVRLVATPAGEARVTLAAASTAVPVATVVVGHGAGGGIESRDLLALRRALPAQGIAVAAVEQPWRLAGRKVAAAPARLDVAWLAVLTALAAGGDLRGRLVVAGRSAGARVACRTATQVGAAGVVALAFPLHPPGRPERSRIEELLGCGVPALVVQGERDPFGGPGEFPVELRSGPSGGPPSGIRLVGIPDADHGFKVPAAAPAGQAGTLAALTTAVTDWVLALAGS